jgi:GNAT superfamily N-acetyltransferase
MVREARSSDSSQIACLLGELGYPSSEPAVRGRLGYLSSNAENPVFVAEYHGEIVGFLSFHIIPLLHLEGGLGRITALVVNARSRGCGLGKSLVAAAECFAWEHGCLRIEITSGDHRSNAHAFYESIGYRVDTRRFLKSRP